MKHFSVKKIIWALILSSCFTGALTYAKPMSGLLQLIQEAKQNNPQIRAARDRLLAANHVIPQARSLPDPKISVGSPMNIEPMRLQMIGASQEIPFPGKLSVRGKIATEKARRAAALYQAACLQVIAELKRIYYDLYSVNKSIEILKKTLVLLQEMEKSANVNYSVGKVPQQDIFRAQTEIARLDMRLVILRQERESLQADINRLLNRPLDIAIHTPSQLSITHVGHDLTSLNTLIKQRAPQLKARERSVEQRRQAVRLSKMNYFPDVEIEGGKLRNTVMNNDGYMVTLKATIPLYFAEKQNNGLRESLSRYNAEIEDLHTTYQALLFQVKNAFLVEQRSARLIELIQNSIIPLATLTFNSSQANYGVGKVDFLTLLNNLLTLQENEIELHNELANHEKAVTMIEEITGKLA
ncbi:TPA: TolC family protein [Legionella pneumophila]|nr:TolC family protein [Legionella pneumophila]HBC0466398.1 TolC family protein [Legionella pneumophila]HBD9375746.1 TolC family protein [Legionella pneumophila]